ncbi:hypothetical protein GYH30_010661 [Glycine max]|uniref:Uncharacterized protein n=1 Tax=Glycine max TaxID=3847 RepID=K7KLH2_SOYBN|nr:hypothetical protein GYH30_010661 [Glycine max]
MHNNNKRPTNVHAQLSLKNTKGHYISEDTANYFQTCSRENRNLINFVYTACYLKQLWLFNGLTVMLDITDPPFTENCLF